MNSVTSPNALPLILYESGTAFQPAGQCDCACDCACVEPGSRSTSRADARTPGLDEILTRSRWLYTSEADPDHLLALNCEEMAGPVVLNRPARGLLALFERPMTARQAMAACSSLPASVVKAAIDDLFRSRLLTASHAAARPTSHDTLIAWLHVTDRCNLRCSYCYLPHVPSDMRHETGVAAIDTLLRSALAHGYGRLKLKYAGGEPLLNFPRVLQWHSYARRVTGEHGLALEGVVLSNGTLLTPEIIASMKANGLKLMISLDGLGREHDRQRPFSDGTGSSEVARRAVELAVQHDLTPNVSVTVTQDSAAGLAELVTWLLARQVPFSLNFHRPCHPNGPAAQPDDTRIVEGMLAAFQAIEAHLPEWNLLGALVDRAHFGSWHNTPCVVGRHYLVFDTGGRIAKCQMDMAHVVTDVSDPDPLASLRDSQSGVQNVAVEDKGECRHCLWRYACAGGCPLVAFWATGQFDRRSPYCSMYRALYPEAIRLEALRLMKNAAASEKRASA